MQLPFNPRDYQQYTIKAPLSSHFRQAACEEVDCPQYLKGWRTRLDFLSPRDLHTALNSGRRYVKQEVAPGETYAVYEPGQQCFQVSRHRVRLDREETFMVRDRGQVIRTHKQPGLWLEDLHEYSDAYQQLKERA